MKKRKHSDKVLQKVKDSLKAKQVRNMRAIDGMKPSEQIRSQMSIGIVRPYDLRGTLESKSLDTLTHTGWTAFVNNRGTLVHILPREGDFHIRIPLYHNMKGCSNQYMDRFLKKVLGGRLN